MDFDIREGVIPDPAQPRGAAKVRARPKVNPNWQWINVEGGAAVEMRNDIPNPAEER
jgi:hypothetical protein